MNKTYLSDILAHRFTLLLLTSLSYLGAGSSGVGASGFDIAERKGYVYAWYNANVIEIDEDNADLTQIEYVLAYEKGDVFPGFGFGNGKVRRQVRDFARCIPMLTSSDLDEFLDVACSRRFCLQRPRLVVNLEVIRRCHLQVKNVNR